MHSNSSGSFLSPPWGGIEYKTLSTPNGAHPHIPQAVSDYSLNSLVPFTGQQLFEMASRLSPNLAFFLPKNTSLTELASLTPDPIEVEEAWFKGKLKALTVYFGSLVR
jgi:trimethylguanosine synthase